MAWERGTGMNGQGKQPGEQAAGGWSTHVGATAGTHKAGVRAQPVWIG